MTNTTQILLMISTLGSGLMAGLFCAFSYFVMRALGSLSPANGIAAMQAINIFIVRPAFLIVFLGTGVTSLFTLISGWHDLPILKLIYVGIGTGFYIIGCVLVTAIFNVPLNNRLAKVSADSKEGHTTWQEYRQRWTAWNHLRSLATLTSTTLFIVTLN